MGGWGVGRLGGSGVGGLGVGGLGGGRRWGVWWGFIVATPAKARVSLGVLLDTSFFGERPLRCRVEVF